jgi:hypothetical protein
MHEASGCFTKKADADEWGKIKFGEHAFISPTKLHGLKRK